MEENNLTAINTNEMKDNSSPFDEEEREIVTDSVNGNVRLLSHDNKHKLNTDLNDLGRSAKYNELPEPICDPEHFEADLDHGWSWVVLAASTMSFCIIGSAIYAVGITHSVLLDKYGESVALTSWAGAVHSALNTLGGTLSEHVF